MVVHDQVFKSRVIEELKQKEPSYEKDERTIDTLVVRSLRATALAHLSNPLRPTGEELIRALEKYSEKIGPEEADYRKKKRLDALRSRMEL
jgi:hypothetical protein